VLPEIKTELPGPKAKAFLERDAKYISTSYTRGYPLVAFKGEGCIVEDPDGNRFLDASSGIGVVSTGHCHPEVVAAAVEQTKNLIHMSGTDFYYTAQVELAEALVDGVPGGDDWRVFYANSGAEAVEACMKLARWRTGRQNIIGFIGAFHGRTFGAMSLTCSKAIQKQHFYPLVPGIYHAPYADPYRGQYAEDPEKLADYCGTEFFEKYLFTQNIEAESVAAIIVEPVQGEGGYIVPPTKFLQNLRKLCDKYGIMLVFDEVQAGMGRTGKLFASEHSGVVPDMYSLAKGIASGFPLGVCLAKRDVMEWPPGTHASTFGGNPVACAAAIKTIELLRGGLVENSAKQGARFKARMDRWVEKFDFVGDSRGLGLMLAIDFVVPGSKDHNPKLRDEVVDRAFEKGLLVLGCGKSGLRFIPPLIIKEEQIDWMADTIEEIMDGLQG
jgi:4-aminobutyrate aminotransferase